MDLIVSTEQARNLILQELNHCVSSVSLEEMRTASDEILRARRVFVAGAGRSGLALKMMAMRLMHLGLQVHVAGEVTTPAIVAGDLLIVASGSGTTAGAVHAAQVAKKVGARLLVITTAKSSPLGVAADSLLILPAAIKDEHGGSISQQYAGALFEQSVLLLSDILFHTMWHQRGEPAEALWKSHANLE
ncbi:MAG: 6-phospho-3-hexuloisomerase [Acidobacteriaceae bacterium]|nr:6-phospho-3-hexuloisomerase [Acidobacteriaceae bacterium]